MSCENASSRISRSTIYRFTAWAALANAKFNPTQNANMKTRNGKIARLPPSLQRKVLVAGKERGKLEIREQLNTRLADGEPGEPLGIGAGGKSRKEASRLVEWLNSNPDVMKVMAEQFEGRPITDNNLSEWRAGGFEEWLTLAAFLDEIMHRAERSLWPRSADCMEAGASTRRYRHIVRSLAHRGAQNPDPIRSDSVGIPGSQCSDPGPARSVGFSRIGSRPRANRGSAPKAASPSAIPIPKLTEDRSDSVVSALPHSPKLAA